MRLRRRSGFEVAPSIITLLGINIQMTRNSLKIYSVSRNPTKGFSQSGIQLEVRNGTFETCRRTLKMSACRRRMEVIGARSERRNGAYRTSSSNQARFMGTRPSSVRSRLPRLRPAQRHAAAPVLSMDFQLGVASRRRVQPRCNARQPSSG